MSDEHRTDVIITSGRADSVCFRTYRVEVIEGPDAGQSVPLERGSLVIGSATDADIPLTDGSVSRAHARLAPLTDGIQVTDLGSKNGTFVSGTRIDKARVPAGTELKIGRTVLRLVPEDAESPLEPSAHTHFGRLHGRSRPMRALFSLLEVTAPTDAPVAIEGEAGVGKKRVARAVHAHSPRAERPFVHIRASADLDRAALEEALGGAGTVLVEQVDALPAGIQAWLCQALDDGISARLIIASRVDLDRAATAGGFDRGLLLSAGVVRIRVPSLRDRASDLPLLIEDILEELGHPAFSMGPADLGRLQAYAWPDNVRELRSVIERAVLVDGASVGTGAPAADAVVGAELPYKKARAQMIEAFEREYVRALLARHDGNISKAARVAGIDRVYLHRLIRKYSL